MNSKTRKKDKRKIATKEYPPTLVRNVVNIDVEAFVDARKFEVRSMENAIKASRDGTGKMAFQLVPRHLRRRAASHNRKRIPLIWRKQSVVVTKRPKHIFKRKRLANTKSSAKLVYLARQRPGKAKWLQTHIYHAKRMKMGEHWGFKLAEKSNDKSKKAVYRALKSSCLLHDQSYYAIFQLKGLLADLQNALGILLPFEASVCVKRHLTGQRWLSAVLFDTIPAPYKCIGPIQYLWRPLFAKSNDSLREIWIIMHPSMVDEAKEAFCRALALVKGTLACERVDSLSIFTLYGPLSHQVFRSAFSVSDTEGKVSKYVAGALENLVHTSTLPPRVILGLEITDPRLNFPPKYVGNLNFRSIDTCKNYKALSALCRKWPDQAQRTKLWDASYRSEVNLSRTSESRIKRKRGSVLIPGTFEATGGKSVPVLLLQSTLKCSVPNKVFEKWLGFQKVSKTSCWQILFPSAYSRDFLKSLVFAGARLCALDDIRSVYSEMSVPLFPYDFPETSAWKHYAEAKTQQQLEKWAAKPPAKRINFAKLGVSKPFSHALEDIVTGEPFVLNGELYLEKFFLLLKRSLQNNDSVEQACATFGREFQQLMLKTYPAFPASGLANVFVRAVLTVDGKGQPEEYGKVYILPQSAADTLKNVYSKKRKASSEGLLESVARESFVSKQKEELLANLEKSQDLQVAGVVLSGGYSLNAGRGKAIALCSASRMFMNYMQCMKSNLPSVVLVKNQQSRKFRLGTIILITYCIQD